MNHDIASLICKEVDSLEDLNKLRLVCKIFNKQVDILKKKLVKFECVFIYTDWCPHSRLKLMFFARHCSDEWNTFRSRFHNKIIQQKIVKVIKHDHDGSYNEIYVIRVEHYPTFIFNGISIQYEGYNRTCDKWERTLMSFVNK